MPSRKRVLLWDFHGTLGYRRDGWSGALIQVLAIHEPGIKVTRDEISPYMQSGFPWDTPAKPHLHLSDPDLWWQALVPMFVRVYVGIGLAPARAQALAARVRSCYLDFASFVLYEDTLPALRALTDLGWAHVILSNHVPELPTIVAHLGLSPHVDRVMTSARIGYEKPNPLIFERAVQEIGQVDALWMIGDNYQADVLGAQAMGLKSILVRKNHPEARYACEDLRGVASVVEGE